MKKKGFTLIELLAVIVILAIITVIAVPKILDVIDKSRKQTFTDGVKLIESGIKTQLSSSELTGESSFTKGDDNCYLFDFTNKNNNYNELKVKNKDNYSGEIKYCDNKFIYTEFNDSKYTINTDENGVETIKKVGSSLNPDTGKTEEDTEKLVEPTITLTGTGSYPTLTEYGVQMSVSLKLSNVTNTTSKIMYRVDNGEFKEYTGEINVTGSKIEAKTVKPNGRESSISEKDMSGVEVAKDAIGSEAFDNDLNTYITMNRYNDYADAVKEPYLLVDKSMQRQKFTIRGKTASDTGNIIVYYYDNNDNLLSHEDIEKQFDGEKDCTIPINTTKIRFSKYYTWTEAYIYEIYPSYNSSIKIVKNYPTLTKNGITGKSFNAIISYSSKAILKQYKIDNGEWKNYSGEIKNITAGSTIYARSKVSNVEKEYITSVTPDFPNAISDSVYDNDLNTYITMNRYNDYADAVSEPYLLVDKSMQGQKFIVRGKSESSAGNLFVYYYNDADELLGHEYAEHQFDGEKEFTIPSNATRIRFSKYYTYTNSYIYEIYPKTN